MFEYLIKGLVIGFSVAAPVGPIGVLTIRRTLNEGRLAGFMTGMGAAFADMTYGMIAGFGLTAISSFLITRAIWLKLTGGLFLLYLGTRAAMSKPASADGGAMGKSLLHNMISTFFLTITNPSTILSFVAIFAGFGLVSSGINYAASTVLVTGVFLGSAIWWLILSTVVGAFQSRVTTTGLTWINRLLGLIIASFGLWALYSILP